MAALRCVQNLGQNFSALGFHPIQACHSTDLWPDSKNCPWRWLAQLPDTGKVQGSGPALGQPLRPLVTCMGPEIHVIVQLLADGLQTAYVPFIPSDGSSLHLVITGDKEISVAAPVILLWQGCRSRMCRDRSEVSSAHSCGGISGASPWDWINGSRVLTRGMLKAATEYLLYECLNGS